MAKRAQKFSFNPLRLIGEGLALIGHPVYVLFSNLILAAAFLLYLLRRPIKIKKGAKKKVIYRSLTLPKFKFRKLKFPKFRLGPKLILLLAPLLFLIISSYFLIFKGLPSPKELTLREPEVSTKIYDRNGNLLYKIYKDKNRTIVPLSQVPPHVRLATLAAEDAEFYNHPGFSIRGIFRAFTENIKTGKMQGGSTITQQLVKNALLTPEKTLTRKLKEVVLSVEVEASYTKDQILEMYLNEVSFGGTAYGIEEASESYFGKDVQELSLAEAAFLAGLPKSPTKYSPFGANPSDAFVRQREVLHLMRINRYITREQEDEALTERLTFLPNRAGIKAPHFVMYVRQLLVDKYGEEMVEKGGLEVTTTLDLSVQEMAEKVVKTEVEKLKNLHVGNGAALILNPQTGEVLGMVGSKDYFDIAGGGNVNVTLRLRQPGSSIKIVNYAYALSNDYTPATIIDDSPITYVVSGQPPYSPKNYGGKFRGKVTLRTALAESRNIPAVKVLASYGVSKMIEEGKLLGITSWTDPSQYGLSLTLGGGEVKLIDLAKVYATVANYGERPEITPILSVKDYKGKVLEKTDLENIEKEKVLDPGVTYMLIDILKDNLARAPEFGLNSALVIKDHPEVAVKTGTSNDLKDNLALGFNQKYLVATWVGNNDGSPMSRIASGVTGASPIWNKIMSALLQNEASIDWKVPEGLVKVNICTITGSLPCNGCPTRQEWFFENKKPTKYCSKEQIQKIEESKILESGASTEVKPR